VRWLLLLAGSALVVAGGVHGAAGSVAKRAAFVAIEGRGTATSVPPGLHCPSVCRAFFPKDALVRLVAHPAPGWAFVRWSGSCSGRTVSCSFNLTSAHDCAGRLCVVGAFGSRLEFVRTARQ